MTETVARDILNNFAYQAAFQRLVDNEQQRRRGHATVPMSDAALHKARAYEAAYVYIRVRRLRPPTINGLLLGVAETRFAIAHKINVPASTPLEDLAILRDPAYHSSHRESRHNYNRTKQGYAMPSLPDYTRQRARVYQNAYLRTNVRARKEAKARAKAKAKAKAEGEGASPPPTKRLHRQL